MSKTAQAIATIGQRHPAPGSQATQIEQSRAVAEVQSMVVVAKSNPRSEGQCRLAMQASCGQQRLADKAFFKYSRGGGTITGPSIHLAVDMARCWGNVDYGVKELARDDFAGHSEMQAYAWDLQTNTRAATTFIVPHKRDTKGGGTVLTDMRDIYENNANNGARRLREMIFRVLPPWFVEEAKDICMQTLAEGDGRNPAEQKKAMMAAFEKIGVSVGRLEAKIGSKAGLWTPVDLAGLRVSYGSLSRGEVSADEEFPVVAREATEAAIKATPGAAQVAGAIDLGPEPARQRFETVAGRFVADNKPEPLYPVVTESGEVVANVYADSWLADLTRHMEASTQPAAVLEANRATAAAVMADEYTPADDRTKLMEMYAPPAQPAADADDSPGDRLSKGGKR